MSEFFKGFKFPFDAQVDIHDNVAFVKKWNWVYEDSLAFQKKAQIFIQQNRLLKIYIFCNHPHCFTVGRGNERGKENLVKFDDKITKSLRFKVHHIHRGGGITFHYPGQWIFYPILDINQKHSLEDLMCWMLVSAKDILVELGIANIVTAKKLMGIWKDKKKLASIGLGLNRFVSEHGLALNLIYDKQMFDELVKINPCGMDSQTYRCADYYLDTPDLLETFHARFIKKMLPVVKYSH